MSIDRTACFGLGWVISHEKYQEIKDRIGEQWGEVEDYFYHINAYHEDTDIFVGEIFGRIGEGNYVDLSSLCLKINMELDTEAYAEKWRKILEFCGEEVKIDSMWAETQTYLLHLLH